MNSTKLATTVGKTEAYFDDLGTTIPLSESDDRKERINLVIRRHTREVDYPFEVYALLLKTYLDMSEQTLRPQIKSLMENR